MSPILSFYLCLSLSLSIYVSLFLSMTPISHYLFILLSMPFYLCLPLSLFSHYISLYSIYFYLGMSPTLSFSPTVLLSTFSSLTFIVCNKSHSRFTRPSPHTCSPQSSPLSHSHFYLFAAKGKKERERAPLLFTSSCFVGASFAQGTIM